jgi:hypothetical protein
MKPRLFSLSFVLASLILLTQSASAADFCVAPDFASAVESAEAIFSGEITNVEGVQSGTTEAAEYVVTFLVETWWKGTPAHEMRVLWRSKVVGCPWFAVGEVGEHYLLYADVSKNNSISNQLPEVTIFNRTSRLPVNLSSESVLITDWSVHPLLSPDPALNRADASDDIKLLLALRQCECLSLSHLPPPLDSQRLTSIQRNSQQARRSSACQACLKRRFKPF